MSEFCCKNGHVMRARETHCPECGEPKYSMDGMTARELREQERDYIPEALEDREEDD